MAKISYRFFSLVAAMPFVAVMALTAWAAENWTISSYKLTEVSAISEPEASSWLGKHIQIGETSIVFDDLRCLAQPRAHDVDTATFLTSRLNLRAEDIGVTDHSISLIETGCTIPGFETILSLGGDRMALLYRGVVFFLSRQAGPGTTQASKPAISRALISKPIPEAGVALKYPEGVALVAPYANGILPGVYVWIATEKVSELDNSGAHMTRKDAEREEAALKLGSFGEDPPMAISGSKKLELLKLGINAKTYATLSRYETCDVSFLLTAVIYNQGYRVAVTVAANPAAIMDENPAYFARAECGDRRHWDYRRNAADIFYRDLVAGRIPGLAASWLQTFQTVLNNLTASDAHLPQANLAASSPFLQADIAACRDTPAEVYSKVFPGSALVLDRVYSLKIPGLEQVCFLTLEKEHSQRFAIVSQGNVVASLPPAAAPRWTVRDIAFEDLNADGLPEIIALMNAQAPDGERYRENEVYWSRKTDAAPQWAHDSRFTREVRSQTDMSRVLQRLRSMLASGSKDEDKGIELVGQIVEEGVYLTFIPQHESKDVVYNLAKLPPSLEADYDDMLQRDIWVRTRVLRSEFSHGVTTFHLEVLDFKIL